MKPESLRVMAEYGSSGIWLVERAAGFRHCMVDHAALGLPEALSRAFNDWIAHYWRQLDEPDTYNKQWMIARGRELARELKRFAGAEVTVLYAPEADVRTDEVIEIEHA